MADVNVNAPAEQVPTMAPPTRSDDQILPHTRAFTASLTILSIYIQQFWDTIRYVKNTRSYSCQLDEQWFNLIKDTLIDTLQITPIDNNNSFSSPPKPDVLINFVNYLGYPKVFRTLSAMVTNEIHHPWRALTTIINLYVTRKTSGFERPRASVHEADHSSLQSKYKFHPRPDFPLHLPYKEYVLGYLKFSAKGTKRKVIGMPILNELITDDIRGGQYYNEYLEKVAKHQRYLAGEEGSDPKSRVPKPAKATKPKATRQSMPSVPKATPVTKPATTKASKSSSCQQPKPAPSAPKSAPAKPQEKKTKADEFIDEGVFDNETRFDDEEANLQRAVEECLKDVHATHRGPLPPVAAQTLLDLYTPKKKSTTDQYTLQRRTPKTTDPTGPSIHHEDEKATCADVDTDTEELLTYTEKSGEKVSNTMVLGTNPGGQDKNQGGPDPGDSADSKPLPTQEILTGSSLDPMDEGFTAAAYPNVQENLKLTVKEQTDQILTNLVELRRKKKRRHDSPKTSPGSPPHQPPPPPPTAGPFGTSRSFGESGSSQVSPPPPSTNQEGQSHGSTAPSSSKTAASAEYTVWTTSDTRFKLSVSSILKDLHMDDDSALDKHIHSSDDEDIKNDHIPKVNLMHDWRKPLSEEDRPATPEPACSIPSSDLPVLMNNWTSALASTYVPPPENSLLAQTSDMATFMDWYCKQQGITELKQEYLEGPAFEIVKVFHPNVTIQTDFFFNKDLEYLRYGRKGDRPALSIPKTKAAYYPDVGLEQMIPNQMWIEEECKYDIATMYGFSHWWFQIQRFYIDRYTSEGDRKAVWTHMQILSVVRIEVLSLYGYHYMKKIVLRGADLKEYIITERDFKYLFPSDFEDLDKYGVQMIMRFNEIHKFSDGTLHQIDEALNYKVTCEILLRIKLVTTGKKQWCNSIRIKLVIVNELTDAFGKPFEVTNIQINDKNKAKRTKPSTRLEEREKTKSMGDDPHSHIRWFNKITSTLKYKNVPHDAIKLMLFLFSLEGAAQTWLEKEPLRSIHTWEDLVSMFANDFFPPSKTTNLKNDITNFQQRFDETFSEACDHFKDLLPAGGNLLNCTPRDALTIIENKSKVRTSRNKPIVSKASTTTSSSSSSLDVTALTEIVKELVLMNKATQQATMKVIKETCVTCGGPHPYYECLATGSTAYVQPLVVQVLILEPDVALKPNLKPSIPYPTRLNEQKAIAFKVGHTSRYSYKYDDESVNQINVIDVSCEEYAQEVLRFLDSSTSGDLTPSDPIIASSSPSFTPFEGGDFILEEIETFLRTLDDLSNLDDDNYDTEGHIRYLEKLLNEDPSPSLPPMKNEDLKKINVTMMKPLIEEPPELEFKDLPLI
uniref:Reverse transcriptase domain-containing protein n=1 Tax=Tanacetum cinerariifolium TaxID=118510 RepID=A0A699H9Y5_TANCI|nr:reverse transcriptase domain-containing protein [Tanacetum cinerariifolium]